MLVVWLYGHGVSSYKSSGSAGCHCTVLGMMSFGAEMEGLCLMLAAPFAILCISMPYHLLSALKAWSCSETH